MRLLSFSPSRQAWLAPLLCLALALPTMHASGQSASERSSSTNAGTKKKTSTSHTASANNKQTAKPAQKSAASSAKKSSTTKTASKTGKTSSVKPSNAPRITKKAVLATGAAAGGAKVASMGSLHSNVVFVQDLSSKAVLYSRNDEGARPIASITKLMTALIVTDANQNMQEMLEVTQADVDQLKHSRSRLAVGTRLSRADMLHIALMSSENRAANALARHYPGGMNAFVLAMNNKAKQLGMTQSRFVEPTGLSSDNVSSPRDLVKLLQASASRPTISDFSTDNQQEIRASNRAPTVFRNTNMLVSNPGWDIKVSKTGFINEAGQCLVMVARINNRDMAIVLLNAQGKGTRVVDAMKIKQLVQAKIVATTDVAENDLAEKEI